MLLGVGMALGVMVLQGLGTILYILINLFAGRLM